MKIKELFSEIQPPEGGWNKLQKRLLSQPERDSRKIFLRPIFWGFTFAILCSFLIVVSSSGDDSPLNLARKQNDLIVYQLGLEVFPEDNLVN